MWVNQCNQFENVQWEMPAVYICIERQEKNYQKIQL